MDIGYISTLVKNHPTTKQFLVGFNGSTNTLYNGTADFITHMRVFNATCGKNRRYPATPAGGHLWTMKSVKSKSFGVTLWLITKFN